LSRTLKLTIAYDGTAYVGWQRQTEGTSIQGLLEAALAEIEGRGVDLAAASRTDAGVHALAQVASTRLSHPMDPPTVVRALNARLPDDVRVVGSEMAADTFHARFDAVSKTYRYRLLSGGIPNPFERRYAWWVPMALDDGKMARAARSLEGTHDFSAFRSSGSPVQTTVRTITRSEVRRVDACEPLAGEMAGTASLVTIELTGTGFLRHMVRAIAGTLVEVGSGRRPPEKVADLLRGAGRPAAGPTAPPQGLFLVSVDY
jgi:tRNA pseudouridine38-40 synthase